MGKRHEKHPLEDKPFVDDFVDWMGSHEGQLSSEVSDVVWIVLKEADVDAKHRKIIWQDAQRLSIAESVKRIHAAYPHFALDLIEDHLIGWLEMGFAPPSYSQEQLDELDQLTEMWVEDHWRSASAK